MIGDEKTVSGTADETDGAPTRQQAGSTGGPHARGDAPGTSVDSGGGGATMGGAGGGLLGAEGMVARDLAADDTGNDG